MGKREQNKADAFAVAYTKTFGRVPSKHALLICCAVAEGESQCGDAWNKSGNWGAVQRRAMTAQERAFVKKEKKNPPPKDAFEQLLRDSDPDLGQFQAWYWAFPAGVTDTNSGLAGDEAGAWRFIKTLFKDAGRDKAIAPFIDTMTARQLAEAMYRTKYYGGFHKPKQLYNGIIGSELNIRDYERMITWNLAVFTKALGYAASTTVGTVGWAQQTINALGYLPALKVDGILGPKTEAGLKWFQSKNALSVTGYLDSKTVKGMQGLGF